MSDQMMHHKVNRNLKHVPVIPCVSAEGESFIPYIVTSQESEYVREHLQKHWIRFGTDFILKARTKPYINAEIFLEDIRTVVLLNLNKLRSLE
jgi:RecJ-like exonuclease